MLRAQSLHRAALGAALLSFLPGFTAPSGGFSDKAAARPFDKVAMSDDELASVIGMGISRPGFFKQAAREQDISFGRQTSALLPVTFDNWFNDVGTPLIVANHSR